MYKEDYPGSVLPAITSSRWGDIECPQETLRSQYIKYHYNSLLILCANDDDEKFSSICNDSRFWDEKLEYELETRNISPQQFFDLSAINGWTKFVTMLVIRYKIEDYKIIPQAAKNGHWLVIKFLMNYIPDWVIEDEKEQKSVKEEISKLVNLILDPSTSIDQRAILHESYKNLSQIGKKSEIWRKGLKLMLENAYISAFHNKRTRIIELLVKYKSIVELQSFFSDITVKQIIIGIQSGFIQSLRTPSGSILIHIYNRTLKQLRSFTYDEYQELMKTINIIGTLLFMSEYYGHDGVKLLEILIFPGNYNEYFPVKGYSLRLSTIMKILTSRGKIDFVEAIKKSKFMLE